MNAQTTLNSAISSGFDRLSTRDVMLCILQGASSGLGGQLVSYTSGTPANPADTTQNAMAYDPTGNLPTLGWNTSTQVWA